MHLTLKKEATKPPGKNFLQQQAKFEQFIQEYSFGGRKINLSAVFAGHNVGVREVADHVWLISFMYYDLGFFDDQSCRVECAPNPFGAKVLPMSPE